MSHARLLLLDLVELPSLPIDRGTQVREAGRGLFDNLLQPLSLKLCHLPFRLWPSIATLNPGPDLRSDPERRERTLPECVAGIDRVLGTRDRTDYGAASPQIYR